MRVNYTANRHERASYQQRILDLCKMLGQQGPAEADSKGKFSAFEMPI
jgi:hypothetical protein